MNIFYIVMLVMIGLGAGMSLMFIDKIALSFYRKVVASGSGETQQDQMYIQVLTTSVCWIAAALVVIVPAAIALKLIKVVIVPGSLPEFFRSFSPLAVVLGMGIGVFLRRKGEASK
jgi:hypothetical protein